MLALTIHHKFQHRKGNHRKVFDTYPKWNHQNHEGTPSQAICSTVLLIRNFWIPTQNSTATILVGCWFIHFEKRVENSINNMLPPAPWKLTLSIHILWKLMLGWKMMIIFFLKWVPFQRGFHFRYSFMFRGKKNPANPTQELARYDRSRQTPKPGNSMKSCFFFPCGKQAQKTG